ncbi:MAG: hypothetical protein CVU09_11130 [Bacteroidetes bacterium HGW-Bacteroidetes-4]|nr:MAG: hypothetical protein CVU09_11130 [Bacteroidetes bacterium HGW-Bacteroidetes-4]
MHSLSISVNKASSCLLISLLFHAELFSDLLLFFNRLYVLLKLSAYFRFFLLLWVLGMKQIN